jgi:hypothetical protein
VSESSYLSPFWTRDLVEAFGPVIEVNNHGRVAIREAYANLDPEHRATLTQMVANGRLPLIAGQAFALPVLSEAGCEAICAKSASYAYTPNDVEAAENRIAEAVLAETDPEYGGFLQSVLITGLAPWFLMVWGRLPSQMASLQIAHYNPDQHSETGFHIDQDSNFTAVISLNPGEFEGGGTSVADGLVGDFNIPPLPAGMALIFDGQRTLHRGLPTAGNRKLLVVWSNQHADVW